MKKSKRITTLAMFTAVSLIIFIIEAQLPPLAPIPGIKLGLANIVTMLVMIWYSRRDAFLVLMLRIVLGSVLTGQLMGLAYSLAGGVLCFIVMAALAGVFGKKQLWVLSVFGAIAHNTGQIAVAVAVTRTWQIAAYFPLLLVSAVITGAFTGAAASALMKNKLIASRRNGNGD